MSENNINPILKAFQEQKVSKLNTELIQAQKLVNLYRALYCFDDAFVEQYNQLLLSSSVEVRRLLSTLMGGNEVRSYLTSCNNVHIPIIMKIHKRQMK